MIRRSGMLVVVLLLLLVQGCAKPPSIAEMAEQITYFKLPAKPEEGQAMVYVVRPSMVGEMVRINVYLDGQDDASEMGYTWGAQHLYFIVAPGKHTIYSKSENWAELAIEAKDGEIIFIEQETQKGAIIPRNSLSPIDAFDGMFHVMNSSLGTIKKSKK